MYFTITSDNLKTPDQWSIIFFVFSLSNNLYYLNNVKGFYISMITCRLFRKTFIKNLIELIPRHMRQRIQVTQTNFSIATVTKVKRNDGTRN